MWVANSVDQTVWRIDPRSLVRTAEVALADQPFDFSLAFGSLWVTSELGTSVTQIDATSNTIQRTLTMPGPARGIDSGPDEVWVALGNGEVARIDPDDPRASRESRSPERPRRRGRRVGAWVSLRE